MNFERLAFLREDHDLKQRDIANILNVKQVNISNWENGKEIIPLYHLNTYANYFNVSLDYLLKLSDDKKTNKLEKLDRNKIGENIKYIRKLNKLTQRDLAKELNTTHSGIWNYENGRSLILTAFAYQICKDYHVSLDWLCGREKKL